MKKVLSVILAAVMLLGCLPFAVLAANPDVTFNSSREFSSSDELQSNTKYIIPSGITMTVRSDMTLYIPSGTRLEIEQGGTLNILGTVAVLKSGSLYCYGTIRNSDNIRLNDDPLGQNELTPDVQVQYRFPDLRDDSIRLQDRITVRFVYNDVTKNVPVGGGTYFVPLNAEVKIYATINEPNPNRDKFDDSLLKLKFNDIGLTYVTGATAGDGYFTTTASTAGDISYARWTKDSDFLTTKRIVLPSGEGFECVPRYPDKVNKTADGTIVVKYGDPFSFKVELDEAYDMSGYEVYIYNGYGWLNLETTAPETPVSPSDAGELFPVSDLVPVNAHADAYGYYNIPEVTGDLTITVTGVMKNSTINLIGNLLETFKNIFNMLKEFFAGLKDLFSGLKVNNG